MNVKLQNNSIQLDYSELRKAVLVLRAVNHKVRKQIIELLQENNKMIVNDMVEKLNLNQSVVSQHLAILRRADIVESYRDGRFQFYMLETEKINDINTLNAELEKATEILRALAHPLRLQILEFIDEKEQVKVGDIYNTLKLEQSITSQHLSILRNADLVATQREGKKIFYSVDYDNVKSAVEAIDTFLEEKITEKDLQLA